MYKENYLRASEIADRLQEDPAKQERLQQRAGIMSRISAKGEEAMYSEGFDIAKSLARIRQKVKESSPKIEGGSVTGMAVPDTGELPEGVTRPIARPDTPIAADASDRELLAKTLHAEAVGEGYEGMLAAGTVIANRVDSGKYGGDSLRGVILKPGHFSAWNLATGYAGGKGGLNMDKIKPSEEAYKAADAILSGQRHEVVGNRTHYYAPKKANPKWGKRAGGDWVTLGNHVFGWADAGKGK